MNILLITTHLNAGGVSRYVINLAKGLKDAGHNVWVAAGKGEWRGKLEEEGINYKYIPIETKAILSPKVLLSFFSLRRFVGKQKIDILHANTRVTQFLAYLLCKSRRVPYVSSFHGFFKPSALRRMFKFCGTRAIAVSEAVKKYLVNELGFNEKIITVVYNGADLKDFPLREKKEYTRKALGADFIIGILGRISEEKGHFLAVETMKSISREHSSTYLLIAGEGRLKEKLKSFIAKTGATNNVGFFKGSPAEFLDSIDLLIMPSRKEGFGYAAVEAFIKKVPVVGFNTGGIAEIISDGVDGKLFYDYTSASLKAAIEEVMSNQDLREKITQAAHKKAEYFSIERMAKNTEKVYEELVENNKTA